MPKEDFFCKIPYFGPQSEKLKKRITYSDSQIFSISQSYDHIS